MSVSPWYSLMELGLCSGATAQEESFILVSAHRKRHLGVCFCLLEWVCDIWKSTEHSSSVNFAKDNKHRIAMSKCRTPPGPWGCILMLPSEDLRWMNYETLTKHLPATCIFTILGVCLSLCPRNDDPTQPVQLASPETQNFHNGSSTLASSSPRSLNTSDSSHTSHPALYHKPLSPRGWASLPCP